MIDSAGNVQFSGFDVSAYQGVIDWTKVKASGQKAVIIRAGWAGHDGHISDGIDKYFAANMKGAIAAGLDVGVYVFSYCKTVAAAKIAAQDVLKMIAPYKLTMPVAFDFEESALYAGYTKAANTKMRKAFLSAIEAAGYYPLLYTYTSFANSYLNMAELSGYDLWQADYRGYMGVISGFTGTKGGWQYSSSGSVSGIVGNVDMNYFYKDYPAIIGGGGTGAMKPG